MANAREGDSTDRRASSRRVLELLIDDHLLVAVILILAIVILLIGPELFVADSWLTLVSGREIVQHGLPRHEALTTIALGRVWTDQQWLAHLIYYGLDRVGGLGLTVAFHALMVSSGLAIAIVASRVRGASSRMTLLAAFVCLFVAPWSWQLRAQSIALPLFAITLALMATDPRLTARRTYLVFPVLVLWANMHGSVILGATLVALAGALALIELIRHRERRSIPLWRPPLFLLAPWLCVLVSPYGTDLVAYYRLLLFDSPVSKNIQEWKAPQPHGYLLVFFTVAAVTVAIAVWQWRRLSAYDLAVLAITLAGAAKSGRGILWFSLAVAMLMPLALDGIVRSREAPVVHRRTGRAMLGVLGALVVVSTVYAIARTDGWYEQGWPARAADATARAAAASPVRDAVWPSDKYADWLLWKEPSLRGRVAWDVRFELLDAQEIDSIITFKKQRPGWREVVEPYPILVLDRASTGRQARILGRSPTATALFRDNDLIVLSR